MGEVIRMPPRSIRREPTMMGMLNYDRDRPLQLTLRAQIIGAVVCLSAIGLGILGAIAVMS